MNKHADACWAYDKLHDNTHDLLTDEGLSIAVQWLLCIIRPGGLLWMGIPCSTWITLSRASTGRSNFLPLGVEPQSELVRQHNRLVELCCYLALTATALGIDYVVEQPRTSILFYADFRKLGDSGHMHNVLQRTSAKRVSVAMKSFGGDRCPTLDETLQTFTETHKIGIRWKVAPNRLPTPTDPPNPVSEAASLLNI